MTLFVDTPFVSPFPKLTDLGSLIVGTGRPSVIAPSYLDQCAAVLSSQHANTDDRLVVSEISLYRALDDALQQRTSLSPDGHCAKLETWRNKWEYLFGRFR